MHNVAPSAFVQLIAVERETCALAIRGEGASGVLSFVGGVLWDAVSGDKRGEAAAIELLSLEIVDVEMQAIDEPAQRAITAPLTFLLLEAMRLKDEDSDAAAVKVEPPRPRPETPLRSLIRWHDGLLGACLIDIPTGTFLEEQLASSVGEETSQVSRSCYELARAAMELKNGLGLASALEDLVLTADNMLLILRFLPSGLLLAVIADPARIGLPSIYTLLRQIDLEELSPWQG